MVNKNVTRILLLLMMGSPAFAGIQQSLKGAIEMDQITYFDEPETAIDGRNEFSASIDYKAGLFRGLVMSLNTELRTDIRNEERDDVRVKEGFFRYSLANTDIKVGKIIYRWGEADEINFTDNINPVNYRDILDTDDETMGVDSLSLTSYFGDVSVQLVAVPGFTASELPGMDSPWRPRLPAVVPHPVNPGETINANYTFLKASPPDDSIKDGQYAVKLAHFIGGWDYSISYYDGWNFIPDYSQSILSVDETTVEIGLLPRYESRQVVGTDFATTLGTIGIRGEAAYVESDFSEKPYVQYALGMDKTFADVFGTNNLYVIVQWMDEINDKPAPITDITHLFQQSTMSRIRLELGHAMFFALQGIYINKAEDYLLRPEFIYNIKDDFSLEFSMDYLGGKETGFFGGYKNNKRYQMKLKYSFAY